ncbi:MFS transporter [Tardiphaga sp.]|jgi:DHA3 family macrolide efflux protein-like MFS transporter|uniref:MFS transporter n=1 Tax=Tardiphaga sp. TaxID=1926292 RepID=UPI0037D9F802
MRFWSIFAGQGVSLVGSSVTQFVLLWWITDTTGSVTALSLAGLAALLPRAILGPIGGAVADRYDRRGTMITADVISAACVIVLMGLFLSGGIEIWHAYLAMALRSAMQAFQTPAAMASTAMLVPVEFIPRAAGLNQTMFGITLLAAAPLGALALTLMPIGWALTIDIGTALLGIIPLLVFRIPQDRATGRPDLRSDLIEGVGLIWKHRGLQSLFLLMAAITLVVMPTFTLVPLLVKEHFRGGAGEVATIEAAAGIGMLIGGGIVAVTAPRSAMLWCLGGFALAYATIALMALAPSNAFWLAVVWWMIGSILYVVGHAPLTGLLQSKLDNRIQGRVLSLLMTVEAMAAPVGLALISLLGNVLSVRSLFMLMGVMGTAITVLGFLSRHIRNLETNLVELDGRACDEQSLSASDGPQNRTILK